MKKQADLAAFVGETKSRINRMINVPENDKQKPHYELALTISQRTGIPLPPQIVELVPAAPRSMTGMEEEGAKRIEPPSGAEWDPNVQYWEIVDNSLAMAGFVKGDKVLLRAGPPPISGELVVTQLYDARGGAKTALRIFQQPFYVLTANPAVAAQDVVQVDGRHAIIMAVFERLIRETRRAA